MGLLIQNYNQQGKLLVCGTGLSFWGGVHPETGDIVDAYHEQLGENVAGRILLMHSSRGSCTGSAVLLGLALLGKAPSALVFSESEDVLTLGAIIANSMYGASIAVVRVEPSVFAALSGKAFATLQDGQLNADDLSIDLTPVDIKRFALSEEDEQALSGALGPALQLAMQTLCTIGMAQGASRLIDVTRAHIDGCIYASPANLTFARTVLGLGGKVRVPTTMNAISVDYANWRAQGTDTEFGNAASELADAYVAMGAAPSFTCAPYLSENRPAPGEVIGWSESNAVIYANSVLGARTNKHPDFLDLFIAMTGRVPDTGVYRSDKRLPALVIEVSVPDGADESVWPLIGWVAGQQADDRIPVLTGIADRHVDSDDLKALCAAFGTTSGAPMLHIEGLTPESGDLRLDKLPRQSIGRAQILDAWHTFNEKSQPVDLVALGSPHFSVTECEKFLRCLGAHPVNEAVTVLLTVGGETLASIEKSGVLGRLNAIGARVVSDLCWCSITRPLFPAHAAIVMTNSAKYAHYGPALSGCQVLFGGLSDCASTAVSGISPASAPPWLDVD